MVRSSLVLLNRKGFLPSFLSFLNYNSAYCFLSLLNTKENSHKSEITDSWSQRSLRKRKLPAHSQGASSWRAETGWRSPTFQANALSKSGNLLYGLISKVMHGPHQLWIPSLHLRRGNPSFMMPPLLAWCSQGPQGANLASAGLLLPHCSLPKPCPHRMLSPLTALAATHASRPPGLTLAPLLPEKPSHCILDWATHLFLTTNSWGMQQSYLQVRQREVKSLAWGHTGCKW